MPKPTKENQKGNRMTTSSPKDLNPLSEQLLKLHVAHELENCQPDNFIKLVRDESTYIFEWFDQITLESVVTAKQIKQVIHRNVVKEHLPGAAAEIAGEAASRLFTSKKHLNTEFHEIISRKQFEEFIDKLLELKEQRNNGLDKIIDLPLYEELISGILYKAITRYIYDSNMLSKNIPGVASMLKIGRNMVNKTAPNLGSGIEDSVRNYITDSLDFILEESKTFLEESVSDEQMKESAMELWSIIEHKKLSEFQQGMDSLDLSEFVAIGYDFWQQFRKSKYFKHCYETVVDYFFEKYGEQKISELMDDLMITPERALTEAEHFAPFALKALKDSGFLEALLSRHFRRFYQSKAAQDCLNQ
jgi:hypothetical protein